MAHCTSGNTVHVKASLDVQKVLFKLKKCSNYFCVSLRDPFIRNVSQTSETNHVPHSWHEYPCMLKPSSNMFRTNSNETSCLRLKYGNTLHRKSCGSLGKISIECFCFTFVSSIYNLTHIFGRGLFAFLLCITSSESMSLLHTWIGLCINPWR